MEHQVFLPYAVAQVRATLADPERAAGCLPGFQGEAGAADPGSVSGRLRVRIGSSTITYRGTLTVAADGASLLVEGQGTEARGDGSVSLRLSVAADPHPDDAGPGVPGTVLRFDGSVEGKGRIGEFRPAQRATAARRLLDRFGEALAEELAGAPQPPPGPGGETPVTAVGGIGAPDDNERVIPGIPAASEPEPEPRLESEPEPSSESAAEPKPGPAPDSGAGPQPGGGAEPDPAADSALAGDAEFDEELGAELDIPLPASDPEEEPVEELAALDEPAAGEDWEVPSADFARRTMIGRSAEEVDHAPPRGRYAPRPAPGEVPTTAATLRWAAPAAALAVASAVVVAQVLRRRR